MCWLFYVRTQLPILSFNYGESVLGSQGYLLSKQMAAPLADVLDHHAQRASIFGLYEDDLWLSCIFIKRHGVQVVRVNAFASSFVLSEMSRSRAAGLSAMYAGHDDQRDWDVRWGAFLAGNCSAPPLTRTVRPS